LAKLRKGWQSSNQHSHLPKIVVVLEVKRMQEAICQVVNTSRRRVEEERDPSGLPIEGSYTVGPGGRHSKECIPESTL
jgi:hypothetical protein